MADSKIQEIAEAITATLKATGQFKRGEAYAVQSFGTSDASFGVWFDGFDPYEDGQERRLPSSPGQTVFHFAIDVQSLHIPNSEGKGQRENWRLVQLVRQTLQSDKTLGGIALKSWVGKCESEFGVDKNHNPPKPLWRSIIAFDVVVFGNW